MIAVHSGAGRHHDSKHQKYKLLCKKASRAGMCVLKSGGTAIDAITAAIKVLEDDPLTNAGYGSNLTTTGKVECDAAIMDGSTLLYAGCGCTTIIKNPIELAHDLCIRQRTKLPGGLVPPSLLVGEGAHMHATKYGIPTVDNSALITKRAKQKLQNYEKILKQLEEPEDHKSIDDPQLQDNNVNDSLNERMDTVGAVCLDLHGNIAAGCSSGGLLLKRPGRVGQGALYASGVWADSWDKLGEISVAATTSGCGEYLVRTQLAKEICDDLKQSTFPTPDLSQCIKQKFLDSRYLKYSVSENKNAGALVAHVLPDGDGTILWGHSTTSMAIGYMSIKDNKPTSVISILPPGVANDSVMVSGSSFKIEKQQLPTNNLAS